MVKPPIEDNDAHQILADAGKGGKKTKLGVGKGERLVLTLERTQSTPATRGLEASNTTQKAGRQNAGK